MWKYLFLCFVMLGWAFFELSGGQDFEPVLATSVSEVVAPTDRVDPIDRSFDREEVARAATNALRSIEFDDHKEAAAPVNVVTDAALWKVSADTEKSAIIENMLEAWCPLLQQRYQATKIFTLYRSIGRICATGQVHEMVSLPS